MSRNDSWYSAPNLGGPCFISRRVVFLSSKVSVTSILAVLCAPHRYHEWIHVFMVCSWIHRCAPVVCSSTISDLRFNKILWINITKTVSCHLHRSTDGCSMFDHVNIRLTGEVWWRWGRLWQTNLPDLSNLVRLEISKQIADLRLLIPGTPRVTTNFQCFFGWWHPDLQLLQLTQYTQIMSQCY